MYMGKGAYKCVIELSKTVCETPTYIYNMYTCSVQDHYTSVSAVTFSI